VCLRHAQHHAAATLASRGFSLRPSSVARAGQQGGSSSSLPPASKHHLHAPSFPHGRSLAQAPQAGREQHCARRRGQQQRAGAGRTPVPGAQPWSRVCCARARADTMPGCRASGRCVPLPRSAPRTPPRACGPQRCTFATLCSRVRWMCSRTRPYGVLLRAGERRPHGCRLAHVERTFVCLRLACRGRAGTSSQTAAELAAVSRLT
jgi:hypothetical protein